MDQAHLCAPHELPALLARHGERLGVAGAVAYLAILQQDVLVPFLGSQGPALGETVVVLGVDGTLAGRAYQQVEVLTQELPGGRVRVWLPLLDGSDRLGVLAVTVTNPADLSAVGGVLLTRLRRFASMTAELVMTSTLYGDTLVRLHRRGVMARSGTATTTARTCSTAGSAVAAPPGWTKADTERARVVLSG